MSEQTIIDGKSATRRHILLFDEDYDFIKNTFGEHPGVSAAVRIMIHEYVERVKKKAALRAGAVAVDASGIDEIVAKLTEQV